MTESTPVRVALAGNPNCGKTSLFNALTGARQHVGNYPGVTVERRSGRYEDQGRVFDVVDLPGTYSLSSYSPEERIAADELLRADIGAVVVVVDSLALRRSLVLLAQVLQLGSPAVLCLNMSDEAKAAGQRLDVAQLQRLVGVPVVQTVGHRAAGVEALRAAIREAALGPRAPSRLVLGEQLGDALAAVVDILRAIEPDRRSLAWIATRLLLGDEHQGDWSREKGALGVKALTEAEHRRAKLEKDTGTDIALFVAQRYYGFVDGLLREVILSPPRDDARARSDAVDAVVVNRFLGVPIFFAVMYGIFWLTFTVGEVPMGWIEAGFAWLGSAVSGLWPAGSSSALRSLLVDGVLGGVGGVVVFLPNILLLFLGLALLEDTGYMSRAAFLVDSLMHRFGLHGRSFIPLVTGFGCSIPGIMATRTMENEKDRLTTMLVLPLMSCGARLPIWMLLVPAFFAEKWRAPALFGIYFAGIALALVLALVLRRTVLRGEEAPFVMELPPYRLPTWRAVAMRMLERCGLYLKKAGTLILGISILMWLLTSYPERSATDGETGPERAAAQLEHSFAGRLGQAMEPVLAPLGFDWKIGVALVGAFAAKEIFVSQLGVIYALGETEASSSSLREALRRDYSPLVGVGLMLFLLIGTPCMATVAITKRESGSWKWALLQFGGLTLVAYAVAFVVHRLGGLFL